MSVAIRLEGDGSARSAKVAVDPRCPGALQTGLAEAVNDRLNEHGIHPEERTKPVPAGTDRPGDAEIGYHGVSPLRFRITKASP